MAASKLAQWSQAVRSRDGRCLDCGATTNLHAHHIKSKRWFPDLALVIENGKTLCRQCHKKEHERNKVPHSKSKRPQRRMLEQMLAYQERVIADLMQENRELSKKVDRYQKLALVPTPISRK